MLIPRLLFQPLIELGGWGEQRSSSVGLRPRSRAVASTESHVQPVYQPYLTTCQGHLCSTYRTIYRVAYRQVYRQLPQPVASCCPGWSRADGHALSCNRALCSGLCQHGGTCALPDRCICPPGWTGRACQTDVDECTGQSHGCSQLCLNTAGSFHCACRDGFILAADRKSCQPLVPAPEPGAFSHAVKEEVKELRSRVEALEQKLQLMLEPFHNLMPSVPEDVGSDPISRLSHSLQQLDRIESLSEQISFLEERLETCECLEQSCGISAPTLALGGRCGPAPSETHVPLLISVSLKLSSLSLIADEHKLPISSVSELVLGLHHLTAP
uniref:Uncharacterized protein n=1 Tax=Melopsittacus undulatus TaxID=13146 RepID=A0A8V5GXW4_MELUD